MINNKEIVAKNIGVAVADLTYVFVFANTGLEHDDTLRFMRDTAKNFGINCIWVEGVPVHGEAISTQHRITDFENAYRINQYKEDGHPFHEHIKKYGLPNNSYMNCSRETKQNTINSYMKSIGQNEKKTFYTAIGIRKDEEGRCASKPEDRNIIYPLVDWHPVDEQHVLDFWKAYAWDLAIPRHLGNCIMCYEKCDSNLERAYNDFPYAFEATQWYEETYAGVGPEFKKYDDAVPRAFFRAKEYSTDLIARFDLSKQDRDTRGITDIIIHRATLAEERKAARSIINKLIKPINKQSDYSVISAKWLFDNWTELTSLSINAITTKALAHMQTTQKIAALQDGAKTLFEEIDFRIEVEEKKGKKSAKAKTLNHKQTVNAVLSQIELPASDSYALLPIRDITNLFVKELEAFNVPALKECSNNEIANMIIEGKRLSDFAEKIVTQQIQRIMNEVADIKVMNVPESLTLEAA